MQGYEYEGEEKKRRLWRKRPVTCTVQKRRHYALVVLAAAAAVAAVAVVLLAAGGESMLDAIRKWQVIEIHSARQQHLCGLAGLCKPLFAAGYCKSIRIVKGGGSVPRSLLGFRLRVGLSLMFDSASAGVREELRYWPAALLTLLDFVVPVIVIMLVFRGPSRLRTTEMRRRGCWPLSRELDSNLVERLVCQFFHSRSSGICCALAVQSWADAICSQRVHIFIAGSAAIFLGWIIMYSILCSCRRGRWTLCAIALFCVTTLTWAVLGSIWLQEAKICGSKAPATFGKAVTLLHFTFLGGGVPALCTIFLKTEQMFSDSPRAEQGVS